VPLGSKVSRRSSDKIKEGSKSILREVEFVGNTAFSTKELRKQMKSQTGLPACLQSVDGAGSMRTRLTMTWKRSNDFTRTGAISTLALSIPVAVRIDEKEGRSRRHLGRRRGLFRACRPDLWSPGIQRGRLDSLSENPRHSKSSRPPALRPICKCFVIIHGSRGYADASVIPVLDSAGGTRVDVAYRDLGRAVSILGKIDIEGNNKTKDKVIPQRVSRAAGRGFQHAQGHGAESVSKTSVTFRAWM